MRRLMQQAHLAPPTFESSRENNEFTSRLLLHHFLDANDLAWLEQFKRFDLNDSLQQALIFVREVGAIDNSTYRQMADCDTLKASNDLRLLKTYNLLKSKGKGKATYYVAGGELRAPTPEISTPSLGLSTPPLGLNTPPLSSLPEEIQAKIKTLGKRVNDQEILKNLILQICSIRPFKSTELAEILGKREDYIKKKFLGELIRRKELKYLYPEMINHPEQAYLTN